MDQNQLSSLRLCMKIENSALTVLKGTIQFFPQLLLEFSAEYGPEKLQRTIHIPVRDFSKLWFSENPAAYFYFSIIFSVQIYGIITKRAYHAYQCLFVQVPFYWLAQFQGQRMDEFLTRKKNLIGFIATANIVTLGIGSLLFGHTSALELVRYCRGAFRLLDKY